MGWKTAQEEYLKQQKEAEILETFWEDPEVDLVAAIKQIQDVLTNDLI